MVKPHSTDVFKSKFPLFNQLLRENNTRCPATAPVLTQSDCIYRKDGNYRKENTFQESRNYWKEMDSEKNPCIGDGSSSPIVLQDPPKSKLKRQLSVDTTEKSEALRIHKKAAITERSLSPRKRIEAERSILPQSSQLPERKQFILEADEVDGSAPIQSTRLRAYDRQESDFDDNDSLSRSRRNLKRTITSDDDVIKHGAPPSRVPHIYCSPSGDDRENPYENSSLLSPNRFNLADIGLTSPFMQNLTPRGTKAEDEVFVFPDTVPPRKLSPYKASSEPDEGGREASERYGRQTRDTCRSEFERDSDKHYSKDRGRAYEREREALGIYSDNDTFKQEYVTSKGFVWPKVAQVTESTPLSPRVVTAECKTRASVSSATSKRSHYDDLNESELRTTLRILEREYARAKETFGSPPPRDFEESELSSSSRSRVPREWERRGISCIDRSPNEKDIKTTREEMRKIYERSISDPRYSPAQARSIIQKPSPLAMEHTSPRVGAVEGHNDPGSSERFREPYRDDVRRRLFMKGPYQSDYQRQTSHPERMRGAPEVPVSTEIPDEVLQFLQSRNFHPEQLENLKDILRRGGAPPSSLSSPSKSFPYSATSSTHYDDVTSDYGVFRGQGLQSEGKRASGHVRERRLGDIDVRVTCEKISERTSQVQEILRELDHDDKECKCAKIEEEIKSMAINAYSKILRADRGMEAYEQFQREKAETDTLVYNSMKNLCGIKCLCKYGRTLEEVYSGSVVFRLNCPTRDALLDLWHTYKVGDLTKQIQAAFVTDSLLEKFNCEEIVLKVEIIWKEYLHCKEELELLAENNANRTPTKQIAVIHARSHSEPASVSRQANQILFHKGPLSPFRERMSSDSSVELSPSRKAFQEIFSNAGKFPIHPPPKAKKLSDILSPSNIEERTSSPTQRRRQSSELEQENVASRDPVYV
ncbi:uncharacterized protein LOC128222251 isoform X2 [Mya arenaria]|uniref:uncharacterized protein LOC128222251 isoform X2 n=1 Tax=Mya arenaria TaxID=6604 RepID=UPI0022DF6B30|nr:uncharacterized protein LOC128222251 isoform X2 [Mya arenaria]